MDKVGIVGCGSMGAGIAEVAARAGKDIVVVESSAESTQAGTGRLEKCWREQRSGAGSPVSPRSSGVSAWSTLEALADRDLVIEFKPGGTTVAAYIPVAGINSLQLLGGRSFVQNLFHSGALISAVASSGLLEIRRGSRRT